MRKKCYISWLITVLTALLWVCPAVAFAQAGLDEAQMKRDLQEYKNDTTRLTASQQQLRDKMLKQAELAMRSNVHNNRDSSAVSGRRLQVSLLTCGPGDEIYEYYGHSAIRVVRTDSAELDFTFNYGVFDFNSGNFALRFAMGETDYICAVQETEYFLNHYRAKGIYIDEQVLNLTQAEAERLLAALMENAKPENCVYRYNFFYDNCATRVRDMIEKCVEGKVVYPSRPTDKTLREAIYFYGHYYKWSMFGQDLLIGSDADALATGRELQFAPLILEQDFANAVVTDLMGMPYAIVRDTHRLLDMPPLKVQVAFPLSPLVVAIIVLVAGLVLGFVEIRRRTIYWGVDTVALVAQGVAGIIVAFLFFFSTHPTVGTNWQVWVLNPLPLIGLWWQIRGARKQNYRDYHIVAAPVLLAFLIAVPFVQQRIPAATVVLVCFLLCRSIVSLVVWYLGRKK